MALRVTALLAHRFGTIAPSQAPAVNNCGSGSGTAVFVGVQCIAKWLVLAMIDPANAA
jgi:hypothetical protein